MTSLRDRFVDSLAPTFELVPINAGQWVVTAYQGSPMPFPTRLKLDEELFQRHAAWIAKTSEDDLDQALSLIAVHLEEDIAAGWPDWAVLEVGLKRGFAGNVRWYRDRVPIAEAPSHPDTAWVADR